MAHFVQCEYDNCDISILNYDFSNPISNLDVKTLKAPMSNEIQFLDLCMSICIFYCNQSHEIQNIMALYNRHNDYKITANEIIKCAGDCENRWRNCQTYLKQYKKPKNLKILSKNSKFEFFVFWIFG